MHYQYSVLVVIAGLLSPAKQCDQTNIEMHACLHRYLERDFTVIEQMIENPLYQPIRGMILDDTMLTEMCDRLWEMNQCYKSLITSCVSYPNFAHMLRVIRTIDSVYEQLCGHNKTGIKQLIKGGYCIENTRKLSDCNVIIGRVSDVGFTWPLILAKMLRFQVGIEACFPLTIYKPCLLKDMERNHCDDSSLTVWNTLLSAIIAQWCDVPNISSNILNNQFDVNNISRSNLINQFLNLMFYAVLCCYFNSRTL